MTQRTAVKTLSSLTLIIAGVAAAGSASAAASNGTFVNDIAASTSIQADMQSLSISEFRDEKSALLADGPQCPEPRGGRPQRHGRGGPPLGPTRGPTRAGDPRRSRSPSATIPMTTTLRPIAPATKGIAVLVARAAVLPLRKRISNRITTAFAASRG